VLSRKDFIKKTTGVENVFSRSDFDPLTNLIKFVAIHISYILYRLHFTANLIDVIGLLIVLPAFYLLSLATQGHKLLPCIGISLIFFHVFIDFLDGPLAKVHNESTELGYMLDEIGCIIDRIMLFVLLGFFTNFPFMIFINLFSASSLFVFLMLSRKLLPDTGILAYLKNYYLHKYSFLSVRMTLLGLPIILFIIIINNWDLAIFSLYVSLFYLLVTLIWILAMIPKFPVDD
jgi:phosphatidylglycerophosphate synthase